jgi:dissimilatory sulfite reductase (desulfoviridin) alpha/beta subunit
MKGSGREISVDHHIEDKKRSVNVQTEVEGRKGAIDFDKLKSGGFIKQRQKDLFTVRLRCPGGRVPVEKLKKVAEAASRYGGDYVHLSFRQSLEIPYVDYKDFPAVVEELEEADQKVASCGARVRVPTACGGCEYNPNGLTDTQAMALMVNEEFFGTQLNHKFKMSFSGCPIDCARTNEMDLGFQGAVEPSWEADKCVGCTICASACREGAIVSDEEGKPVYDPGKCLYCADCIRACPTEAWVESRRGHMVRVGGKHGRHPLNGRVVAEFIPDDLVPRVIRKTLDWYRDRARGKGRVRIGDIIRERGIDDYLDYMKEALGPYLFPAAAAPDPIGLHSYLSGKGQPEGEE